MTSTDFTPSQEQALEMAAIHKTSVAIGGPTFQHVLNKNFYDPLVAAGLVNWSHPHPSMSDSFAAVSLTPSGRRMIAKSTDTTEEQS